MKLAVVVPVRADYAAYYMYRAAAVITLNASSSSSSSSVAAAAAASVGGGRVLSERGKAVHPQVQQHDRVHERVQLHYHSIVLTLEWAPNINVCF